MKKVCVVTATRAEYGLLRRVIQEINNDSYLELCLIVTGTHLSEKHGYTKTEIEDDGFVISECLDILAEDNDESGICNTMSNATIKFSEMYERQKPDMIIVLGDRYELIPICSTAMIYGIPIAHISGGEVTEGAIDDTVRHCITKMSYLHFPGCEEYRRRIIQLGEKPSRVYNFGDVGVENIYKAEFLKRELLEESMKISLDGDYALATFHPVTLEANEAECQTNELINAMKATKDITFIVTMSNADVNGDKINELFKNSEKECNNIKCYNSLGINRYLSLMKDAKFVIGNSSSGIVEAPCFNIPTINIGNRQKGRLMADSIINCEAKANEILDSIEKATSKEFLEEIREVKNPYGRGDTSNKIVDVIRDYLENDKINLKKGFYDLEGV